VSLSKAGGPRRLPNNVWIVSHNISHLGQTFACYTSTTITQSTILLDDLTYWDTNGGTVPFDKIDLEGVVVHELGHATGFGILSPLQHFTDADTAFSVAEATMCATLSKGEPDWRSLNSHDSHTYLAKYD
jgi:hypothetical protein